MFEYLLGDVVAYKLNQALKNSDLDFQALAECYHLEQLFALYADLQHYKQLLAQNVQSQLVLDQLFMQLMNVEPSSSWCNFSSYCALQWFENILEDGLLFGGLFPIIKVEM